MNKKVGIWQHWRKVLNVFSNEIKQAWRNFWVMTHSCKESFLLRESVSTGIKLLTFPCIIDFWHAPLGDWDCTKHELLKIYYWQCLRHVTLIHFFENSVKVTDSLTHVKHDLTKYFQVRGKLWFHGKTCFRYIEAYVHFGND